MAIGSPAQLTVNWARDVKIITVKKGYMSVVQLTPTEIRELNTVTLHADLRDLEDDEIGIVYDFTHNFVGPITVGGVALAQVIEITNGYTITFEENAVAGSPPCPVPYAVNLSGSNNNVADVTNVNSVSIRSSNSAGLTYSKQVEDSAFNDARIWVNIDTGQAGSQYPIGTTGTPSNNFNDAVGIIAARTLPNRYHFVGDASITNNSLTISSNPANILGESDTEALLHLGASAGSPEVATFRVNVSSFVFQHCQLDGFATGAATYDHCTFDGFDGFAGDAFQCNLKGTIVLDSVAASVRLLSCYSSVAGTGAPRIDCNNIANLDFSVRDYNGGLIIDNFSDAGGAITIDMNSGHAQLSPTCIAGTIIIRGTGQLTDNSGPNCTVIFTGLVEGGAGGRGFGGM